MQQVRGQGNPQSARALAIMEAAVYDSVNAIDPTHAVYHVDARAFPGVSTASADAAAAPGGPRRRLRPLPQPAERDAFDDALDGPAGRGPRRPGRGRRHRPGAVRRRARSWPGGPTDGSARVGALHAGTDPGDWQPTPPNRPPGTAPATPQWPDVTPFALDERRPVPPRPAPRADQRRLRRGLPGGQGPGRRRHHHPTTRTPEQTEIARFWAGVGVSNAGVAIWNQIAQTVAAEHDLSLAENARLFAQLNVAKADAFIAGCDAKYAYNFWRPVTAIRAADTDGNPDTVADPTWTPLLATPNHPSYVSTALDPEPGRGRGAGGLLRHRPRQLHGHVGRGGAVVRQVHGRGEGGRQEPDLRRHPLELRLRRRGAAGPEGRPVRRGPLLPAADGGRRPVDGRGRGPRAGERVPPRRPGAAAAGRGAGPLAGRRRRHVGPARASTSASPTWAGLTLGQAADGVIWLDDNAAGWGWFVDRTPRDDSEFATPGDQGEQGRMDLLTVLTHEVGHLLGHDHEAGGVMAETLAPGTRQTPVADGHAAGPLAVDGLWAETSPTKRRW